MIWMLRILQSYFATKKATLFPFKYVQLERRRNKFEVKFAKNPASKSLLIQFIIVFEEFQQQIPDIVLWNGHVLIIS